MLEEIRSSISDDKVLIVCDGDRPSLYRGLPDLSIPDGEILMDLCDSLQGFEHLDLAQVYRHEYSINQQRFNDTNNAHWNPYGARIVRDAVALRLFSLGWLKAPE